MVRVKEALGLDWQPGAARIVRAERHGGSVLFESLIVTPLPDDPREAAPRVRAALEARGWDGIPCAANLPDRYVMLRLLEVSESDSRPLADIAREQTETLKDLAEAQTFSALHPLPREGRSLRALYALTRSDRIAVSLALVDLIGLETTALVPDPLAVQGLALHLVNPPRDSSIATLYIGPDSTDLLVGPPGSIRVLRRLAAGSRELLQSDRSYAALQNWFAEIQRAMGGTASETTGERPARLLVCGHMDLPDEGLRRLEQLLGVPCRQLHTLMTDRFPAGVDASFAVAAGLSLSALGEDLGLAFNLLPAERQHRRAGRQQIPYWLGAGAVASLAVWLWAYSLGRETDRQQLWLDQIQTATIHVRRQEGQLAALKEKNGRLQNQIQSLNVSARNTELSQAVVQAAADSLNSNDWIILFSDAKSYHQVPGSTNMTYFAAPASPAKGVSGVPDEIGGFRQFVIEGITPVEDLSTVRAMIEKLRRHPLIRSADLLPDDRVRPDPERDKRWNHAGLRLFAVEFTTVTG